MFRYRFSTRVIDEVVVSWTGTALLCRNFNILQQADRMTDISRSSGLLADWSSSPLSPAAPAEHLDVQVGLDMQVDAGTPASQYE